MRSTRVSWEEAFASIMPGMFKVCFEYFPELGLLIYPNRH